MKYNSEVFDKIVDNRRSYREFYSEFKMSDAVVKNSLERAIKAPNSSNMQLWEFYRIKSKKAREEVAKLCLSQLGAETASEIVVFVTRPDLWKERQRVHLKRLEGSPTKDVRNKLNNNSEFSYYNDVMRMFYDSSFAVFRNLFKSIYVWNKRRKGPFMTDIYSRDIPIVAQKSTGLAAQTFMLSISAEGYDSLPMEGLDAIGMKQFLKLPKAALINMAIAVGKGKPAGLRGERFRLPYDEVVFEI